MKFHNIALSLILSLSASVALFSCSDDEPNQPNNPGTEVTPPKEDPTKSEFYSVNKWMYDYMNKNYLWNEPVSSLDLDYSLGYEEFLKSILEGVASKGNVNADDGYYYNGERIYFSYVDRESAAKSKTAKSRAGDELTDCGIYMVQPIKFENVIGYAVLAVAPGTEADKAGLKRGSFIDRVGGQAITLSNYQDKAEDLVGGNVSIRVNELAGIDENGNATLSDTRTLTLGASTYTDPAIYMSKVEVSKTTGKKVAYLLYMGFETADDAKLIDVFDQFKKEGAQEIIVDLRYNPGGAVVSSVLLGTMIAGKSHNNGLYLKTVYNKQRTAKGEVGNYYLGQSKTPEGTCQSIANGVAKALDVTRVFVIVSGQTASASELLINGLRGLDFEVNVIGTQTLGKNCGMEGIKKTFGDWEYTFYPITFYCQNAKGFQDYGDGFTPDLVFDDEAYYPGEFGTEHDALSGYALNWAYNGTKPTVRQSAVHSRAVSVLKPIGKQNMRRGGSIVTKPED